MKKLILILSAVIVVLNIQAQNSDQVTVPLSTPGKSGQLTTNLKSASIKVSGVDRTDILVKYTLLDSEEDEEKM